MDSRGWTARRGPGGEEGADAGLEGRVGPELVGGEGAAAEGVPGALREVLQDHVPVHHLPPHA